MSFSENVSQMLHECFGKDAHTTYIKMQFKINHTSFSNRIALLAGLLAVILIPWGFLVYAPQDASLVASEQKLALLNTQTTALNLQRDIINGLLKSDKMAGLIEKHKLIKNDIDGVNQQLLEYRDNYADGKTLAKEFYSAILNDANHNVSIEHFGTLKHEEVQTSSATSNPVSAVAPIPTPDPNVKTPAPAAPSIITATSYLPPEVMRYTISLKGDYFSIAQCLKRLEALKWRLFWNKMDYKVEHYPQALVTLEFYTIKARVPPAPVAKPAAKPGVAT